MSLSFIPSHIVQSPEWSAFKAVTGRETYFLGGVSISTHKLPLLPVKVGYCPKVNPFLVNWDELSKLGKKEKICFIRFDVPNIAKEDDKAAEAVEIMEKHCRKSPKNTFAKHTIYLDISISEDKLLVQMQPKTRYNIRLSAKKGVVVKEESNEDGLSVFLSLQKQTADRQRFYVHPDSYYQRLWRILFPKEMAHLLVARFKGEPLAAWMVFTYKGVLYYPYGGSSIEKQNLMASNLLAWEAIKFGKKA